MIIQLLHDSFKLAFKIKFKLSKTSRVASVHTILGVIHFYFCAFNFFVCIKIVFHRSGRKTIIITLIAIYFLRLWLLNQYMAGVQ